MDSKKIIRFFSTLNLEDEIILYLKVQLHVLINKGTKPRSLFNIEYVRSSYLFASDMSLFGVSVCMTG